MDLWLRQRRRRAPGDRRGIERILDACRRAGIPEPEVEYEATGLWVVFNFLPEHQVGDDGRTAGGTQETSVETSVETGKVSVETGKASVETSVKTSSKIIQLLGQNPEMTLAQVAIATGRTLRAVELATAKLVKTGRLRHVGPKKKGHWKVLE